MFVRKVYTFIIYLLLDNKCAYLAYERIITVMIVIVVVVVVIAVIIINK